MQDLLLGVGKAKYLPVKEYLRVEVQFHLFLASENDRRYVKNQLHAMIILCRVNGLQYTLSWQLDRCKNRSGGFGEGEYKLFSLTNSISK